MTTMKKKQTEKILEYMEEFGSISQLEAVKDIGCYRLSARIADLKKEGYEIESEFESSKNRFGETVSFKRYKLGGNHERENSVHIDRNGNYCFDCCGMGTY